MKTKILKKNSPLWQKAVKYSRRKGVMSKPIELSEDGKEVKFTSLIREGYWWHNEKGLDILLNSR